jgi:hypothetical protein
MPFCVEQWTLTALVYKTFLNLTVELFEDYWQTGVSRLQHVTCVDSSIVTAILRVCRFNYIATINKYFNRGCMHFQSFCINIYIIYSRLVVDVFKERISNVHLFCHNLCCWQFQKEKEPLSQAKCNTCYHSSSIFEDT